jgi:glycosyltransferase involved in cell wall biosynthesis
MSENQPRTVDSISADNESQIAVGFVATKTNSEELARAILRAKERGHEVFVTHHAENNIESVRFAEQLGANVVDPTTSDTDRDSLRRDLAATARAHGCEGLIFQIETLVRIDYERSKTAFEESGYAVEAIPESAATSTNAGYVLVGIPAYNEVPCIKSVVREAMNYADDVIVVDDGSTDDTTTIAREAGATVINHAKNKGYGAALNTLFKQAHRIRVDHLVVLDGDGQHEPADIDRLVEAQQETEHNVVIGSRFVDGAKTDAPLYRRLGLWIIAFFTNISMGKLRPSDWVGDTQSGFRAYDSDAIESIATSAKMNDRMSASIDILFHVHKLGYSVIEVPTSVYYSVNHSSTHNPISHGITIIHNIIKTVESERPVTVLGLPGLLMSMTGFGFLYWTAANYLRTGSFPLGLGIVTVLLLLTGIFSAFTAIILHALNNQLD